ncbi:MAG: hypothetical protein ACHQ1H_05825 [Nitrososphaerales archaeon]
MKPFDVEDLQDVPQSLQEGVLEGINKGLESLGQNVREVFYSEMEARHNLERNEILSRPEKFSDAICEFFTNGSTIVERTIGREIVSIFGIPVCPGLNFRTALEIVRRHPRAAKSLGEKKLRAYDSTFCKTCQKLGLTTPVIARVPFSDCQDHFMKRVFQLRKTVRTAGRVRFSGFFAS